MRRFLLTKIYTLLLLSLFQYSSAQVLQSDENLPMGVIDENIIRCFTSMKPGSFTANFKFKTENYSATDRTDGFSIPLVGDLNNDGNVEVVALGAQNTSGGGLAATATYLYILNGKTGRTITKYPLPETFDLRLGRYHGSPSYLALVDADRNGLAEIIVTYGYTSLSGSYSKRIVSYEVTKDLKLVKKWGPSERYDKHNGGTYDAYHAANPIPQIVDVDGDSEPEVIVYNKVYSAKTGELKITLEDLGPQSTYNSESAGISTYGGYAYTGRNRTQGWGYYDKDMNFSFIYDLDADGVYEIIAGGKVYYGLNPATGAYKVKSAQSIGVGDGITGVADINGDGKAEIIVTGHMPYGLTTEIQIQVYDPGFLEENSTGGWRKVDDPANSATILLAQTRVKSTNANLQGSMSYVYIGDIDGKTQNGKKFPEISILGPKFYTNGQGQSVPVHPNVSSILGPNLGGLNSNGRIDYSSGSDGSLISFTWDDNAAFAHDRLKISFIMEHDDRSVNTGFTLFDFDNDGVQDICYRDERTIRILSPIKPFVKLGDRSAEKFTSSIRSFTGFEYPVIADIDADGSADMVVMGSDNVDDGKGYVYAVGAKPFTTKFAPAPKVWNQFMYSPLKINEDLTTPIVNRHPLSEELAFVKEQDKETGIKTFIYNNTITQVVKSAVFGTVNSSGDSVYVLSPIVPIPDAQILHGKLDAIAGKLQFYVKNIGNATLSSETPICIFKEGVIPSGLFATLTLGEDVSVGDSILVEKALSASDVLYNYVVRVTDSSTSTEDLFMKDGNYEDCNWADNQEEYGSFVLKNDAATAIQYSTIIIDLFENDILPLSCDFSLQEDNLITPAGKGVLEGDFGKLEIVNNKLQYTAPASYPGGVVKIEYTFTCETITKSGYLYVFVIENCSSGFAGCLNSPYQVCLVKPDSEFLFQWYDANKSFIGEVDPYIPNLTTNVVYYAKPKFDLITNPEYSKIDFPMGKLTITALSSSGERLLAKWKGLVDTNWDNPANWVKIENGKEKPINWSPISCVDVIVEKMAPNYPILTHPVNCGNIKMEDRTMIAGIHYLTYINAQVDLVLSAKERERFVMWSAPLQNIYSGDYHFLDASSQPKWGNVYMNFFQAANPDYSTSVAAEKTFTATFGSVGAPLSLGTAFNIKVVGDKTSGFSFPKVQTSYTDANGNTVHGLNRTLSGRFITDGAIDVNSGHLNLPVNGDNTYRMIQVVNPFMAYLKVADFLAANSGVIESAYKLWDGNVNRDFITVLPYADSKDQRYLVDDPTMENANLDLIAPLQSFFVMKKNPSASITSLAMNANMTTTKSSLEPIYSLKSSPVNDKGNVLRISANQNSYSSSTLIRNVYGASASYSGGEDASKLFSDFTPITVYTISEQKVPFAINTTGDFTKEIKLGIRTKSTDKPITLQFTNLDGFGKKVYLRDKEKNELIDLMKNPNYTFTIAKSTGNVMKEINERFTLQVYGTTTNIDEVNKEDIIVSSANNTIYVTSPYKGMNGIKIYTLSGSLLYSDDSNSTEYKVDVNANQIYIVKIIVENDVKVSKVFVK